MSLFDVGERGLYSPEPSFKSVFFISVTDFTSPNYLHFIADDIILLTLQMVLIMSMLLILEILINSITETVCSLVLLTTLLTTLANFINTIPPLHTQTHIVYNKSGIC